MFCIPSSSCNAPPPIEGDDEVPVEGSGHNHRGNLEHAVDRIKHMCSPGASHCNDRCADFPTELVEGYMAGVNSALFSALRGFFSLDCHDSRLLFGDWSQTPSTTGEGEMMLGGEEIPSLEFVGADQHTEPHGVGLQLPQYCG